MNTAQDFTPSGLKVEGSWENDRNQQSSDLFKAIMREAFNVQDVIIGHHLLYVCEDKRDDGFSYQVVQEIPAADTLIFDHEIAKKIWGSHWKNVLTNLALTPVEKRDAALKQYWEARCNANNLATIKQAMDCP